MGNGKSHTSQRILSASDKLLLEPDAAAISTQSCATASASSEHPVVRQLILQRSEKLDDVIFSVKKRTVLRFILGPSLCHLNVRLFIKHQSVGVEEEQGPYELSWHSKHAYEFSSFSDNVQIFADVQAAVTGSFHYFFTVDGTSKLEDANGSGYFIVEPELVVGSLNTDVPLNSIVCQTVLSKNLGPFSGWLERLSVAKKTGYNVIHFTPLQELGDSQSAYALRDFFSLNPSFGSDVTLTDIAQLVTYLDKEWGMLSFTDLVLNHAANESKWIAENPQCIYNLVNTPHLKPAFLLDCMLARFSKEIADGRWSDVGLPPEIRTEDHLQLIQYFLGERIEKLRLWEFYQVDVERTLADVVKLSETGPDADADINPAGYLTIQPTREFRRFTATVDVRLAANILSSDVDGDSGRQCIESIHSRLHKLNAVAETAVRHHLNAAISNIIHSVWHRFINMTGERAPAVTSSQALMNRYFRLPPGYDGANIDDDEALMNSASAVYCWAHSGWVPDDVVNPLVNFAEPPSNVYLRRELNSWTDSVKLRYGAMPDDCPALWARAAEYAAVTASAFHGIRLDNCHSTPLHVAEYVLQAARRVRPDLYVFAELYAGSEAAACRVANRLGINATVEVGLHAHSAAQLAQKVTDARTVLLGAFSTRQTDWLTGRRRTRNILFDQSHDDASPLQRRTYVDPLPSAAVLYAASSAVGSNRGYDELVPRTISVISETRWYRKWGDGKHTDGLGRDAVRPDADVDLSVVDFNTGLIAVKRTLNELHVRLAAEGFEEVAADMLDDDIVLVTRRCSSRQLAVVTVAHTAFHTRQDADPLAVKSFEVPGVVYEIRLEASVVGWSSDYPENSELIVGLSDYRVESRVDVSLSDSHAVRIQHQDDASCDVVELVNFPPGSVVVLAVRLISDAVFFLDELVQYFNRWIWDRSSKLCASALHHIKTQFRHLDTQQMSREDPSDSSLTSSAAAVFLRLVTIVSDLGHDESRRVLYEADTERHPSGDGFTVYHVPGHGDLTHCGLTGVATLLLDMRRQGADPAKHPLGVNLLQGDWLMDYIVGRLAAWPGTPQELSAWFKQVFVSVKSLPRCLVPCYFEAVVSAVHTLVTTRICN